MSYFGPFPKTTNAYAQDGSGNEYFGEAANGADVDRPRWTVFQKQNVGGASNPTSWIILFPVDTGTGVGSNEAKFVWGTNGTAAIALTYAALGMSA